jgi:hypothetical protein
MSAIRSPANTRLGFATAGAQTLECNTRRELPASGYALEVNGKLKAAFAIRDRARTVEEAVKTFPNASGSNL